MFKFLFKIVFFVAVVVIVFGLIASKKGAMPGFLKKYIDPGLITRITQANLLGLGPQISNTLDSLVTHPNRNLPVVLGLKVSNDSLNAIVDVIQRLPPDQVTQLKNSICTPASPSAAPDTQK